MTSDEIGFAMIDPVREYLESESLSNSSNIKEIEQRIRRLERVVYAEELTSVQKIVSYKLEEIKGTFSRLAGRLPDHVGRSNSFEEKDKGLRLLVQSLDQRKSKSTESGRKIYVDVSNCITSRHTTGIQRTGENLISAGYHLGGVPVFIHKGRLYTYDSERQCTTNLNLAEGDYLLMSDASWQEDGPSLNHLLKKIRASGAQVAALIYDILPLQYPEAFEPATRNAFRRWFYSTATKYDRLICISHSVMQQVKSNIERSFGEEFSAPKLSTCYLGYDFQRKLNTRPSKEIDLFLKNNKFFFLSVGTVEPRKGYSVALDAFEALWLDDYDLRYVIVGRYGWMSSNLAARLDDHPERGKRLFWWKDLSDEDLAFLYGASRALIAASVAEGFGLPIIEAAYYGTPSICSDIDVFREIGRDQATYFTVAESESLAKRLQEALDVPKKQPDISPLSWEEAVKNIFGDLTGS